MVQSLSSFFMGMVLGNVGFNVNFTGLCLPVSKLS